ncbi:MAG: hypothetical protein PHE68_00975 [Candidatus Peribacteraceae bacterium]|nr:hypothetical protein [Candidatus Peribacteraceae bacterium]MDD5075419.1 hypothetical protein [Candidatus Peribacteraceae bacterium]
MSSAGQSEALSAVDQDLIGGLQKLDSMLDDRDVKELLELEANPDAVVSERVKRYCSAIRFLDRHLPVAFHEVVAGAGGIFANRVAIVLGQKSDAKVTE